MIKAIETVYKGYRFRSRLEAKWAVFFDALGVKWEYEKEGYDLGEAGWYLPDFWLPDFGFHIEVKGGDVDPQMIARRFYKEGEVSDDGEVECVLLLPVIVVSGPPWDYRSYEAADMGTCDLGVWGCCEICRSVRFGYRCAREFSGTGCDCQAHSDSFWYEAPEIINAINAARSARFEHGESGAR